MADRVIPTKHYKALDAGDPTAPMPIFRFYLWYETADTTYLVKATDSQEEADSWGRQANHRVAEDPRWRSLQ